MLSTYGKANIIYKWLQHNWGYSEEETIKFLQSCFEGEDITLEGPQVYTQNRFGDYVQAIPEPFYGFRKRCQCGEWFWTTHGYRAHYALKHILGLD